MKTRNLKHGITQAEYVKASGLSKGQVSKLAKVGMPLGSVAEADAWRGTSARKPGRPRKPKPAEEGPYRPPESSEPVDPKAAGEGTPAGAYERQRSIEREAYRLATHAMRTGQMDAARMVSVHAQAARNLSQARQEVLDLMERERSLVTGDWVRRAMLDHDGAVVALAKAMPKQLAGRIAPHDPEHAERELERWVQEVFLKTLWETSPWK